MVETHRESDEKKNLGNYYANMNDNIVERAASSICSYMPMPRNCGFEIVNTNTRRMFNKISDKKRRRNCC